MRRLALAVLALLVLWASPAWAAEFPQPTGYLVDAANAVPDSDQQALEAELSAYAERSSHQLAVAVVRTTGGKSIEDYANDLFGRWGIGDAKRDDGVLLVVATSDRTLRIEVGRGLEGQLTDVQSADIIRNDMVPALRSGDVTGAVRAGERKVRAALGDPTPDAAGAPAASFTGYGGGQPVARSQSSFNLLPLLVLGFVAVLFISRLGGRRRRRRHGMFFPLFLGSGWGGFGGGSWGGGGLGGGGFGGGGGGFGGFGGGSSGGGGASGSW